ncbi:MAG: DUF4258 domain-containing protein [Candidatus Liptonbacteria bacterium]|nr:DUF4258 domain-containing protein [Candidatus Liptonbacteria bacterium]
MDVIFSSHARYQINERNISSQVVLDVVAKPDKVKTQSNLRKQALKKITYHNKKYLLVVIYEETKNYQKVITVFLTSKIKKYF